MRLVVLRTTNHTQLGLLVLEPARVRRLGVCAHTPSLCLSTGISGWVENVPERQLTSDDEFALLKNMAIRLITLSRHRRILAKREIPQTSSIPNFLKRRFSKNVGDFNIFLYLEEQQDCSKPA